MIPEVRRELSMHSNDFFTCVPHDFGNEKKFSCIIDDPFKLRVAIDELRSLALSFSMVPAAMPTLLGKRISPFKSLPDNPIDEKVRNFGFKVQAMSSRSREFKLIEKYLLNTKNGQGVEIQHLFKVRGGIDEPKFNP